MERINFTYWFEDGYGEDHMISCSKKDLDNKGIRDTDVCEMFLEFMRSAGFSERNILDYFKE